MRWITETTCAAVTDDEAVDSSSATASSLDIGAIEDGVADTVAVVVRTGDAVLSDAVDDEQPAMARAATA